MADFSQSRHGYTPEEVDGYINRMKLEYEDRLAAQKERIFELVESTKKLTAELESYRKKDEEISSALLSAVAKARDIEAEAELRYENELSRLHIFHTKWVRYYNEIKQRYPIDDELMSVERFLLEMNKILGSDVEIGKTDAADRDFVSKRQEFLKNYQSERERVRSAQQPPAQRPAISAPVKQSAPQPASGNDSERRYRELLSKYSEETVATGGDKITGFNPIEKINRYIAGSASDKPQIGDSGFDMNEVLNPGRKLDLAQLCKELGLMDDGDR